MSKQDKPCGCKEEYAFGGWIKTDCEQHRHKTYGCCCERHVGPFGYTIVCEYHKKRKRGRVFLN